MFGIRNVLYSRSPDTDETEARRATQSSQAKLWINIKILLAWKSNTGTQLEKIFQIVEQKNLQRLFAMTINS